MSFDVLGPVLAVLVIFAALIVVLRYLKAKDKSFTFRVFTALGMGIVLGAGIQLALGRGSDAATAALDWMSLVGTGYIDLLRMLVMPLVFVAIVGAFTRTKAVDNLGKIGGSVLAVLLITVAIAALFGWATIALSGLAGADFTQGRPADASGQGRRYHHPADHTVHDSRQCVRRPCRHALHVHHRRGHLLRYRGPGLPEAA